MVEPEWSGTDYQNDHCLSAGTRFTDRRRVNIPSQRAAPSHGTNGGIRPCTRFMDFGVRSPMSTISNRSNHRATHGWQSAPQTASIGGRRRADAREQVFNRASRHSPSKGKKKLARRTLDPIRVTGSPDVRSVTFQMMPRVATRRLGVSPTRQPYQSIDRKMYRSRRGRRHALAGTIRTAAGRSLRQRLQRLLPPIRQCPRLSVERRCLDIYRIERSEMQIVTATGIRPRHEQHATRRNAQNADNDTLPQRAELEPKPLSDFGVTAHECTDGSKMPALRYRELATKKPSRV
jgi:hypothetical protein